MRGRYVGLHFFFGTLGTAVHHLYRRLLRVQGTPFPCFPSHFAVRPRSPIPQTKLFISSEVPIYQVFSDDSADVEVSEHMRSVMDDLVSLLFCAVNSGWVLMH